MLEELREEVCQANLDLVNHDLVILTWGNLSAVDANREYMIIKPSGVEYEILEPEDMVVVNIATGKSIQSEYRPSSDTETHLALYRAWPEVFAIAHTHSLLATAFAQAEKAIPCLGTTHADLCRGDIPLTRALTAEEISAGYEAATGAVIIETFNQLKLRPLETPAVLCRHHGPFTWGKDSQSALHAAVTLEAVARLALDTWSLQPGQGAIPAHYQNKHYQRKHGANAYYGQKKT